MNKSPYSIRLPLAARGKVRELYTVDENHLLIVASDRISAFDVVLPNLIPQKGEVLTELGNFWFARTQSIIPNHLTGKGFETLADFYDREDHDTLSRRAVIVQRTNPLPFEAVVRGYLAGSAWEDYRRKQSVCGISLPKGLQLAEKLPEPIFTPATKATPGEHDQNISFATMANALGEDLANQIRRCSLDIYTQAGAYAEQKGIVIADTKLEFGLDANNRLVLIDEVLTPDSSRFWDVKTYCPGISPPNFDKQFVRDYLESLNWNKRPPAPALPQNIVDKTHEKYMHIRNLLLSS